MDKNVKKFLCVLSLMLISMTVIGCKGTSSESKQLFTPETYENDELNFSIDFPSDFEIKEKSGSALTTVMSSNGNDTFSVIYVSIPISEIGENQTDFIELMKKNEMDALNATNCVLKDINTDHSIGIEIEYDGVLSDNNIKSKSQFILIGDKYFQLGYKTKDEQIDEEYSNQFFNSFTLKE